MIRFICVVTLIGLVNGCTVSQSKQLTGTKSQGKTIQEFFQPPLSVTKPPVNIVPPNWPPHEHTGGATTDWPVPLETLLLQDDVPLTF